MENEETEKTVEIIDIKTLEEEGYEIKPNENVKLKIYITEDVS
jgi:hypothetical protein